MRAALLHHIVSNLSHLLDVRSSNEATLEPREVGPDERWRPISLGHRVSFIHEFQELTFRTHILGS
jgi:hypothetical protein